ncbi:MAG: chemotaxis response regulator protein-glutamate methylesterase [Clostridiales bacterium]|uniref:protein-glutamate methylesterase/protein-glutamine glutaminase n=1 Tax=Clostridium sp. N3C TaxID=1776758 RepID=UPI00092DFC38|nr:chemotaxis response regulator protein-glutamate methylesterase [Clostridium sp. N3C]NLZ48002.1 chemotaxis response regulator protein-glutamate methylesterase [Clostridiales bacterium]SCN24877.1 Chemotaxis response regulator protein-glutamate methylesterase [Clostridium sp. N3C]
MSLDKKIRVLVVDDSRLFREVLSRGINSDPNIEVVATASDPFEARDKILEFSPHVMTCDVEMPKMNGIEFIRRLLPQYVIPVIVVSTVSEAVFDAMDAGAVDFVTKPDIQSPKAVEELIIDLIAKIKIAASAKVSIRPNISISNNKTSNNIIDSNKVIAIGASTGGTEAIYNILSRLPSTVPGIVIVQHIPAVFSNMFAQRLNSTTNLSVKEAETGDVLEQGKVLIAPGNYHMRIKKLGSLYKVECFQGEKVNGHCPSVDVLFESVAKECGSRAVGIILTGMGYDGAKGLLSMRRQGARTIGQDEKSSVVYGMPRVAYNIGAVERQTSLERIPDALLSMLR